MFAFCVVLKELWMKATEIIQVFTFDSHVTLHDGLFVNVIIISYKTFSNHICGKHPCPSLVLTGLINKVI